MIFRTLRRDYKEDRGTWEGDTYHHVHCTGDFLYLLAAGNRQGTGRRDVEGERQRAVPLSCLISTVTILPLCLPCTSLFEVHLSNTLKCLASSSESSAQGLQSCVPANSVRYAVGPSFDPRSTFVKRSFSRFQGAAVYAVGVVACSTTTC